MRTLEDVNRDMLGIGVPLVPYTPSKRCRMNAVSSCVSNAAIMTWACGVVGALTCVAGLLLVVNTGKRQMMGKLFDQGILALLVVALCSGLMLVGAVLYRIIQAVAS